MNATAEHPNLNQSTGIAVMFHSPSLDSSVLMLPDRYGSSYAPMRDSSSATQAGIADWLPLGGYVWNPLVAYEHDVALNAGIDRIGCRFFQYDTESSTAILVDFWEAENVLEAEFDPEYPQVVDDLRSAGREIPAEDLIEMLRNIQEDPEEPEIKLFSLQAMARFLIKYRKFDDPIIGPDPIGIMQAEWHIIGNGLLVMAFLDDNQIHCVAQADATPQSRALNKSVQLTENQAIEEFGYLVPLR